MKKIYLSLLAIGAFTSASAQTNLEATSANYHASNSKGSLHTMAAKTSSVAVQDDNWYFLNKHDLRNPNNFGYPGIYNSPAASYTSSSYINKMGSVFENPGTVIVSGAAGIAINFSTSPSPSIPVGFFLYNASGSPLLPTGAPIASVAATATSTTLFDFIGGNFGSPVIVTGPYAIVMQNLSANNNDKIIIGTSNAKTVSSSTTVAGQRFGESLGVYGDGTGAWFVATNVLAQDDDREAIVAPFIAYSFSVGATASTYSTCNTTPVNFINSSTFVGHRQYNVNALVSRWAPFANTTELTQIAADSAFTWNFGGNPPATVYGLNPSHTYTVTAGGPVSDQLIGKLKTQVTPSVASVFESASWTMTVTICNVGLTENNIENQFAVYPNPATDRVVVLLNNANVNTQIQVLNALGQVVLTKTNLTEKNELNTESLAKGVYFVRVSNGKESSTSKLIINK